MNQLTPCPYCEGEGVVSGPDDGEIASLRADKARLDWLEAHAKEILGPDEDSHQSPSLAWFVQSGGCYSYGGTLREAVDDGMTFQAGT